MNPSKRFWFLLTLVAILSVNVQAQETPKPVDKSIVDTKIASAIMGEDRRLIIHLPRNYAEDVEQKYPVMYVLDGTSQDQHTTDKMTVFSDAGLIPKAIVVGLPNTSGNRERDQTPPFMRRNVDDANSVFGAADKFLSFIEKELIPYIEKNYRTTGYRTLSGNSRGGLFVLYSLIEKPDLFQARFCFSVPVWRFDNLMVSRVEKFLSSSARLNSFLFLSVGEKETEQMVGGFDKMLETLKKTGGKKIKWASYRTPHAIHQDNVLISTSKGLAEWGKYLSENRK